LSVARRLAGTFNLPLLSILTGLLMSTPFSRLLLR
jgi:hypothetical protein